MALSFLIMGPELEAEVRRVREHAEKPENYFRVGSPSPGDNPAFVLRNGFFRAVFTITEEEPGGRLLRHLSVSTATPGHHPGEWAVYTLAHLFGLTGASGRAEGTDAFTRAGPDWEFAIEGRSIEVAQEYRP